jgi:hypothetical protein
MPWPPSIVKSAGLHRPKSRPRRRAGVSEIVRAATAEGLVPEDVGGRSKPPQRTQARGPETGREAESGDSEVLRVPLLQEYEEAALSTMAPPRELVFVNEDGGCLATISNLRTSSTPPSC